MTRKPSLITYKDVLAGHDREPELRAMIRAAYKSNARLSEIWRATHKKNPDREQAAVDRDLEVVFKSKGYERSDYDDIVTYADKAAEDIILPILTECRDIPIMSEEASPKLDHIKFKEGDQRWLVDPLDGTLSFRWGNDNFGVTIALQELRNGKWETVVGLVSSPIPNRMVLATEDKVWSINDGQGDITDRTLDRPNHVPVSRVPLKAEECDAILKGRKIETVVYANDDHPKFLGLRQSLKDTLESKKVYQETFSTAHVVASMAIGNVHGAILGGDALSCPWDTDAAIHIAEKSGMLMERLTCFDKPVLILAKSRELLEAIKTVVVSCEYSVGKETNDFEFEHATAPNFRTEAPNRERGSDRLARESVRPDNPRSPLDHATRASTTKAGRC